MLADLEEALRGEKSGDREKQLQQTKKKDGRENDNGDRFPAAKFVAMGHQCAAAR